MKSFYLAPNKDSFRLARKKESIEEEMFGIAQVEELVGNAEDFEYKMRSFYLAPNKNSFRLAKKISQSNEEMVSTAQVAELARSAKDFEYKMKGFSLAPSRDSFRLIKGSTKEGELIKQEIVDTAQAGEPAHNAKDSERRKFLKILGMAGLGLAATSLFPKKADALILGGTPTSSVVGVKNVANTRINPATEETLEEVLKTTDLTFDAGSLQVKVTSLPAGGSSFSDSGDVAKSGLVDAQRHVQVDVLSSALPSSASTETTLQTIAFGGFKFKINLDSTGLIDYVGEAAIGTATSAAAWRIKKVEESGIDLFVTWAGTGSFDQVWDNRASLTYS